MDIQFRSLTHDGSRSLNLAIRTVTQLHHRCIDTEHILIGIGRNRYSRGRRIIAELGVPYTELRDELRRRVEESSYTVRDTGLTMTTDALQSVQHALYTAISNESRLAGSDHLLLGLLRYRKGIASESLAKLGITYERVRQQMIESNVTN